LRSKIPWAALDDFSATAKHNLDPSALSLQELNCGVVEWNWGDMLSYLELDLVCKFSLSLLNHNLKGLLAGDFCEVIANAIY
jgi:hypothetical protein